MDATLYALVSFALVVGAVSAGGAILLFIWRSPVQQDRIQPLKSEGGAATILRWEERADTKWERYLERLGRMFAPRDRAKSSRLRNRLVWAGFHDPRAPRYFIGAKVVCLIVFGCAYLIYGAVVQRVMAQALPVSLFLGVLGCFLPDLWLRKRIKTRQLDILHALPNVLDLLMVCIEAGLGFDAAFLRVADRDEVRGSPLHQEMFRTHLEVRAGRPREEALRGLGERTGVEEVKALMGAFIQTERLGTSLGKTLRIHAESARVQRRVRAEEHAQLAPLKMLFPTVVFLFPVFFLVTFAQAMLKLLAALKSIQL